MSSEWSVTSGAAVVDPSREPEYEVLADGSIVESAPASGMKKSRSFFRKKAFEISNPVFNQERTAEEKASMLSDHVVSSMVSPRSPPSSSPRAFEPASPTDSSRQLGECTAVPLAPFVSLH